MHATYKYYCIEQPKENGIVYRDTSDFEDLTKAELLECLKSLYGDNTTIHLFRDRSGLQEFVEDFWHRRGYKNYTMAPPRSGR